MATKLISRTENEQLWRARIARLQSHRGSLTAFSEKEGITIEGLKYWRDKLSAEARAVTPTPRRPAFVPVEVVVEKPLRSCNGLPDPRWAAEFVLHLCGASR
jgi:hypothetical protein